MTDNRYIKQLDPIQGLVDYVLDVKPYHTKIVDVMIEYVYNDDTTAVIREDVNFAWGPTKFEACVVGGELVVPCNVAEGGAIQVGDNITINYEDGSPTGVVQVSEEVTGVTYNGDYTILEFGSSPPFSVPATATNVLVLDDVTGYFSFEIISLDEYTQTIIVNGPATAEIFNGQRIRVTGTTSNDGNYTIEGSPTFNGLHTSLPVAESLTTEVIGSPAATVSPVRWYIPCDSNPCNIPPPPEGEILLLWTQSRASINSSFMSTVSYGNGTYVAGWWNPIAEYSSDGITWTSTSPTMNLVDDSAYGQGKFIIVGSQSNSIGPGRIASSVDGTSWTAGTNPFGTTGVETYLRAILYSPELDIWLLTARGGGYKTSVDGINWSATVNIPDFDDSSHYRGSWGDGKFVLTNSQDIAISTDAINWTVIKQVNLAMDVTSDRIETTIAHDGMIIAMGRSINRPQGSGMYSTDNGLTWDLISVPGHNYIDFKSVAYGNDRYIATGSFNIFPSYLVSSTDGINWAIEPEFAYPGGGLGDGGRDILYNPDASEWVMVGHTGYTAHGRYELVFPLPPIPNPGPTVEGAWSVDLISTTGTSGTQQASPTNIYYRRRLFTTTYSSDEIVAATGKTVATVSGLRFLVSSAPQNQPLPDYAIGMKATENVVSTNNSGTNGGTFTLAKEAADETFTTGVIKEFIFDTPVVWIEGYNLVVSFAWGQVQPSWHSSGQQPIGTGTSYHVFSDSAGAYSVTDAAVSSVAYRPVIQILT